MDPQLAHDQFIHVRIIIGIVTGLSVTRLLTGLARFVQHPVRVWRRLSDRQGALAALALIAMFVADRCYHGAFVTVAIAAEVYWIVSQFEVLE